MLSGLELRDALLGTAIQGPTGVRYHVREVLGEGGQGWVFKANYGDPHGFGVVVKVLRPESVQTDALQRFEREAAVLRQLGAVATPNPHIVRFFDYGTLRIAGVSGRGDEHELPFIVLEHVNGQTLAHVIRAHGGFGLPIIRVRRVMRQVARALHTVHEQRIVHRDLKPSNVLLAPVEGVEVVKVTDFGLVKLPDLSAHRTVSIAGASLGYAPPEQYEMGNPRVGTQTDVFSFASVLFEVLCGTEAFPLRPSDSPLRVVARMLTGERPTLASVHATVPRELRERPDLTAALDREIGRALSADPAVRHASIREFWERIEPLLDQAADRKIAPHDSAAFAAPVPSRVSIVERAHVWSVIGRPLTGECLRAANIAPDRHSIVAIGKHGLYQFAEGSWSAMHLPAGVDPNAIRGLQRMPSGELVLFGDGGLVVVLGYNGSVERLVVAPADTSILGCLADAYGLLFVGERPARQVGVVVDLPSGGPRALRDLPGTTRLEGVARLVRGAVVVCGAQGTLLELSAGEARPIPWGRTGHLRALVASPDGGAFTVGTGGHALRISPPATLPGLSAPPSATLEAVQTTRDLGAVVLDDDDVAWAVGAHARLLQRRNTVWARVPVEPAGERHLVAVRPRREGITVLVDDGTVIEAPAVIDPRTPAVTSSRTDRF